MEIVMPKRAKKVARKKVSGKSKYASIVNDPRAKERAKAAKGDK